ncbi:MAG: hypothetical protein DME34_04600 [Verrucomicrobia bacterium]|nr:MAG: hypothetical protein DME34_04600 [Verrucomicrobiota bacterium]
MGFNLGQGFKQDVHATVDPSQANRSLSNAKRGAPNCRKVLTGKDWQRSELQKRYAGYFSAYLKRKIAAVGANA